MHNVTAAAMQTTARYDMGPPSPQPPLGALYPLSPITLMYVKKVGTIIAKAQLEDQIAERNRHASPCLDRLNEHSNSRIGSPEAGTAPSAASCCAVARGDPVTFCSLVLAR
jgi:hypothetical protein